MQGVFSHKTVF